MGFSGIIGQYQVDWGLLLAGASLAILPVVVLFALIFITGGAFTPRTREYLNQVDNLRIEKPFDVANFRKIVAEVDPQTKGIDVTDFFDLA